MSTSGRTTSIRIWLAAIAVVVVCAVLPAASNAGPSIGELNSQLGHEQARQRSLSASIGQLTHNISTLDTQISLVRSREASVRSDLARDRDQLTRIRTQLARERRLYAVLKARLARARTILARQLVSDYERDKPDLIGVVLDARGFNDLLEQIDFLKRAQSQTQSIIQITTADKAAADRARHRLSGLEVAKVRVTNAAATRVRALAGMNALLQSKQTALARTRNAQQAALAVSRTRGAHLRTAIVRAQAAQAAAERAASAQSAPAAGGSPLGPSGGWAIPFPIVQCESGGQNVPPNSAGASGYYQIIPSTWKLYGGTGPAAYLASKAEQDAVATRIWNGSGASAWDCAAIVGIH